MSDTPGRSGKGAGARADVAPSLQAQTTVEFAGDDTDEANAVLSGNQSCSVPTSRASALEAGLLDEILVNVTPNLLGDGVRMFARSGRPVRLETIAAGDTGQITELRYGVRR
jgi:hypothetical protein